MKINEVTEPRKVDTSSIVTPDLKEIFRAFEAAGKNIKIAGGAVRDLLLGKEPKDIDLATDATPDEMKEILAGFRTIDTGLEHGTITVLGRNEGEEFEITTLRIDVATDGRHADVEWTTDFRQDADRRDLTFNAMFMDLDGTLHDFHGGEKDLYSGTARFVGNAQNRIEEDFLRILRFFRFQGRMKFPKWDQETLHTIKRTADGLKQISGERVAMEMEKILKGKHTIDLLEKMDETGILDIIGFKPNLKKLEQVKKVTDDFATLLAASVGSTKKIEDIKARWKLSNTITDSATFVLDNADVGKDETTLKVLAAKPKTKINDAARIALFNEDKPLAKMIVKWEPPVFPITGKDLIARGVKPGKEMGMMLADLRKKWEDSGFPNDFSID